MFGYNDVQKGFASFPKQDRILIDSRNPRIQYIHPDTREFAQRLGELTGHVATGASKAVASTVLAGGIGTYAIGSFRNACEWTPITEFDNVAQTLATGINGFNRLSLSVGKSCVSAIAQAVCGAITPIIQHPAISVRIAAYTGGIGTCLYFACNEGVQAADADGILEKTYHAARAVLGMAGACIVPLLLNPSLLEKA
jgi:hypothetical protein